MSLVDHLRSSPPYGIWRALRERQQLARFEELLRDGCSAAPYGKADAQAALRQRAGGRRALPARPHVVAFGAQDWEQHGLWPAWSRLGPFVVFDYGRRACATSGPSREVRKALGQEFLAFLGQRERDHGPVHLVFLYAAGFWIDPELLQELSRRGVWTLLMALDDKHQQPGPRRNDLAGWQLEVARTVDLYWTTWRGGVDWLAGEGVTPLYAPEAAEPDLFKPSPVPRDIDVLWVGRAYGQRVRLVRWLRQNGFSVTALGPGWPSGPLTIEAMIQSYSRAKVVLGMGGVGHTDRIKHLKGRDFEVPMSGAVYLTSFNPELADHYAIGQEILCYSSFEECSDVLRWILSRTATMESMRSAARKRCLEDHTWDRRLRDVVGPLRSASEACRDRRE